MTASDVLPATSPPPVFGREWLRWYLHVAALWACLGMAGGGLLAKGGLHWPIPSPSPTPEPKRPDWIPPNPPPPPTPTPDPMRLSLQVGDWEWRELPARKAGYTVWAYGREVDGKFLFNNWRNDRP